MDKQTREAKEMTKQLPKKERLKNFWYYNRTFVLIGIFAALVLAFTLYECTHQAQYDLEVFYITQGPVSTETTTKMQDYFAQFIEDTNADGLKTVLVSSISATDGTDAQMMIAAQTKFMAELSDGEAGAFIVDKNFYELLNEEGYKDAVENTYILSDNADLKAQFGFLDDPLYYVTKALYDREKDDVDKLLAHDNANRLYEALVSGAVPPEQ